MSILTEKLPESLNILGKECAIRTDFRTWIKVTQEISSNRDIADKSVEIFKLVFEELPPRFNEGLMAIAEFHSGQLYGKVKENKDDNQNSQARIYDFDFDADMIYAAFLQQYNVDLCSANLHWWQFKALLNSLSEDTQFVKVMRIRAVKLSDIKDKEKKKYYRKMKAVYRLPDNRTEEQKEDAFNNSFAQMFA